MNLINLNTRKRRIIINLDKVKMITPDGPINLYIHFDGYRQSFDYESTELRDRDFNFITELTLELRNGK